MKPINIILADDHQLFRRGLRKVLEEMEGMQVTGEATDGAVLLKKLGESGPETDVVLMDLNMPNLNGIQATAMVRERYPAVKIIVLTLYDEVQFIARMVEMGADGYLLKDADTDEVEKAIREVVAHGFYFNANMLAAMRKGSAARSRELPLGGPVNLTGRELEVLKLICQEYTATEIAEKLFISTRTVDGHRQKLLDKTGSRNTAGLVIYAMRKGVLDPSF